MNDCGVGWIRDLWVRSLGRGRKYGRDRRRYGDDIRTGTCTRPRGEQLCRGVLVGEKASSRILKVSEACKIMGHERIGL